MYAQVSEAVLALASSTKQLVASETSVDRALRLEWLQRAREVASAVLRLLRVVKALYHEDLTARREVELVQATQKLRYALANAASSAEKDSSAEPEPSLERLLLDSTKVFSLSLSLLASINHCL